MIGMIVDKNLRYYARSWAKPGSIYILVVWQRMRTCHAGCAAYPYFLTCLGLVRQCSGDIGASYSSKRIPPLHYCHDNSLVVLEQHLQSYNSLSASFVVHEQHSQSYNSSSVRRFQSYDNSSDDYQATSALAQSASHHLSVYYIR